MKNNTLVSVRTNCDFSLDYETSKLNPQSEIIILTTTPIYKLTKKDDSFTKEQDIEEFRFKASLTGINALIGELQLVVQNMNAFEQLASGLNVVIENSKIKK
jgi:hypothetical protein